MRSFRAGSSLFAREDYFLVCNYYAFYILVAEFEACGFDSTTTPESGVRAQVLRLN